MKSIILALLPGLEDETSEDFDRTLAMLVRFKESIRPRASQPLGENHATGDAFFWQCFFLASITSHSRRSGALAYLVRFLPSLGAPGTLTSRDAAHSKLHAMVTSPEPGLLVRCFASGLADEQILIQRGFLDLLVSHLPLNSDVLQQRVKPADLELLVAAAVGVVTRRDMSLNRRLWAWLLGPEPAGGDAEHVGGDVASPGNEQHNAYFSWRTSYFEEFGLQSLTRALLEMISRAAHGTSAERARPYRICLSLMDRWEIGGLVVPEVFMPIIDSVRSFQKQSSSKSEFTEVLRSASVFFDGIESGLIYSEIVGLLAQAIGPGNLSAKERMDKLSLTRFIVSNFNIREEEMVTIHAPITSLAALFMLEDTDSRKSKATIADEEAVHLGESVLSIVLSLLDLVPSRTFPEKDTDADAKRAELLKLPGMDLLKKIKTFYVNDQGNLDASSPPFTALQSGELLLHKAVQYICDESNKTTRSVDIGSRVRILSSALSKTPASYSIDTEQLLSHLHKTLGQERPIAFPHYSSMVQLSTQLRSAGRIDQSQLSDLVLPLVRHAWSYLSASEPKYHVETVRCLWQLQSVLSLESRDVEAALATILAPGRGELSPDYVRTFGVLWSHTLQDAASDRRGSRSQNLDARSPPRLAGMDHYHVMLTQSACLVLDALLDDRTQSSMAAKTWINSTIGIDRYASSIDRHCPSS